MNISKRFWLPVLFSLWIGLLGLWLTGFVNDVYADVPAEYIANYEIHDDFENILNSFVQIDAKTQMGNTIDEAVFSQLHSSFEAVFPYFPKDYEFKVVYQQCLLSTEELSASASYQRVSSFMENCYQKFSSIIKDVNSKYTVLASAKLNPTSGPAPLTVTFDARASIDPSNQTIPSNNFFWYYRDVDGVDKVIGVGPVVNYTFDKAGNYIVHLTVRSSNKVSEGIFDGEKIMSVDVAPKSSIISVYANGKKLNKDEVVKIGVQEAQRWVVFDASATIPIGWRKLQKYAFEIKSKDGFVYSKNGDGAPTTFAVALPGKWEFTIQLTTVDNEWNQLSESFNMVVADPVALIKLSPKEWDTSTMFSFDASTSYAVVSRIRLYTREVFDQEWNKLYTLQWKSFKQDFKQPGMYTVKLTVEDEQWKTDVSTMHISVDSTKPLAQFVIKPIVDSQYPSEFILDASPSSDIDEINGYDELSYERKFSNMEDVNVVSSDANAKENNEKVKATFNKKWKQKIKLIVRDKFGKMAEIEKEVDIKSTLRPKLFISPVAWVWWTSVSFVVKSNQDIISYEWNFGDGETRVTQSNKINHVYSHIGNYDVTLKVIALDWMDNTITKKVFVWEKNGPIASYVVTDSLQTILGEDDSCTSYVDGEEVEFPAYRVDRYEKFKIDPSDSVNAQGENKDLSIYFQAKNGDIHKKSSFSYDFDELWCKYIDMTVEDTSLAKTVTTRIWFKVVNALPQLSNLVLFFPQYGNEMGIGFQENNVKDIFTSTFDPLVVKVSAQDAIDPDGNISYYKWYYYYKDDPTRILGTKITPSDIPYAFFSLPRMPGEFMFGVTMYDNDDGKQRSEDIIGNGPLVFFPPDVKRPDIPIVTLKIDQLSAEVWDEIQFDVISKVISDNADFAKERTIMYDFDGDGEWDMTTKKDRVTHVYTKANEAGYIPRAAVLYRWYKWVAKWWRLVVKKWLKPRLLFNRFDKYVIARDVSLWEIVKKNICMSAVDCKADDSFLVDQGVAFDFVYPEYKKYVVQMDVEDKHANKALKRWVLDVTWETYSGNFKILSIPKVDRKWDKIEFFVWNNLDNSILYNFLYDDADGTKECYIDTDITVDSDGDGIADQDKDFKCNELHLQSYTPQYDSVVGRIYYQVGDKMLSQDFTVSFLDFEVDLDADMKKTYDTLQSIIVSLDTSVKDNVYLKTLLIGLKDGLLDKVDSNSALVTIQDYMANHDPVLTEDEQSKLDSVMTALADDSVVAAQWGNIYEQSKTEILNILPYNLASDVKTKFADFETIVAGTVAEDWNLEATQNSSEQDKRKMILQDIVNMIASHVAPIDKEVWENQIQADDMDLVVMPNICKIMDFYSIASKTCVSDTLQVVPQVENVDTSAVQTWVKKRVKTLFVVLWIVVVGFVVVVVLFALKAKKNEEEDDLDV